MSFRMRLWERPQKPMQRPNRDKALARLTMEMTAIIESAPVNFVKPGCPNPPDRTSLTNAKQAMEGLCNQVRALWGLPHGSGAPSSKQWPASSTKSPSPDSFDALAAEADLIRSLTEAGVRMQRERDKLRDELEQMRAALRRVAVSSGDCRLCGEIWWVGGSERHASGCLAAPDAARAQEKEKA